jgi:carbon-monoxide dehydrogenase medium subunit
VRAADFFLGPLTTALADDEMILEVRLPAWPRERRWAFSEFARRRGDFALAGVALFYDVDGRGRARNAHIGVVGACYHAKRLSRAEEALDGHVVDATTAAAVAKIASEECDAPGDFHASVEYRSALVGSLLEGALAVAAARRAPS